jgi:hypothetical protein
MILKSALGSDINNDISTTNRLDDDDDDNIAKKVNIFFRKKII